MLWYRSRFSSDFSLNRVAATLLYRGDSSKRVREILKCARLKLTAAHQPFFIPSRISDIKLPLLILRKQGDFPDVFGVFSSHAKHAERQVHWFYWCYKDLQLFVKEENQDQKRSVLVIRTHDSFPRVMVVYFSPILAQIFQDFSERLSSACLRVVGPAALQTVVSCLLYTRNRCHPGRNASPPYCSSTAICSLLRLCRGRI